MNFCLNLPLQLLVLMLFVGIFGGLFSEYAVCCAYTLSILFKEFLIFLLPFIVFTFVLTGILSFKRNAPAVLIVLLGAIFISNALVALISYGLIANVASFISCTDAPYMLLPTTTIIPLFSITLPQYIRPEHAMIAAVILGLLFSYIPLSVHVQLAIARLRELLETILRYTVIPLLPVYVFGFLLKIRSEGILSSLMHYYGSTVVIIVALQIPYLIVMYFVAKNFSWRPAFRAIVNALPSYVTAFSTMSSAATVPVAVENATVNTHNKNLAKMAMPIMANVHLVGDSIAVPVLAITTLILFKGTIPTIDQYLYFLLYFCTSMFAVSGIPGGGILVMIPILVSVFGFTPEMVSIITTLYVLMDCFGTAANVMGDGALVIIVNKILERYRLVY